jgi:hypothetical protein
MKKTKRLSKKQKRSRKAKAKAKAKAKSKTIGGNGEEMLSLVNPIVRTLFSRERNIFFFLEFVNVKVNSDKADESNSALGIKEMLSVLSIIVECINSRITCVEEEEAGNEDTWRDVDGGGKKRKRRMKGGNGFEEMMKLGISTDDINEDYWGFVSPNVVEQYELALSQYDIKQDTTTKTEATIYNNERKEETTLKVADIIPPSLYERMTKIGNKVSTIFQGAFELAEIYQSQINGVDINETNEEEEEEKENVQEKEKETAVIVPEAQIVNNIEPVIAIPLLKQEEKQSETDLDAYVFLVQLTNLYISKKIEKINTIGNEKQQSILNSLTKYVTIIFDKLSTVLDLDIKNTTTISTTDATDIISSTENGLLSQEDKDNFNNFASLEKEFANIASNYQALVDKKLEEIEDKSILARISSKFCEKFHNDLKEYIKSNEEEYRDFIDKLFLQKDSNENSVLMKIREYNYLINENIIGMLLNKDITQTIFKDLGLVLDATSLFTLHSMFSSIASEGLLTLASNAAQSSALSVVSGQILKDPKQLVQFLLKLNNGRELTSKILKPDNEISAPLAAVDLAAASSPINLVTRFGAKSLRNCLNSASGLLYRNNESVNNMIKQVEDSEQVINLTADVSNIISDMTYALVNNKYKTDDDIWKLLVNEKTLYDEDVEIQDKLNKNYVDLFLNYKKLIIDLNTSICKVRCKETMVPEKFLEDSSQNTDFINYLNIPEDEIVMMFKYVSEKFPSINETLLLLEKVTSSVIKETENKFDVCEFIKKKIMKKLSVLPVVEEQVSVLPVVEEQVQKPKSQFTSSSASYADDSGYKQPSYNLRYSKFGGSQIIVPREKETEILNFICIIINCDFKEKFGVDTDSITDRSNIELERKNALGNLTENDMVPDEIPDEINGKKLLDEIKANGYDSFLEEISVEYKSHSLKKSISTLQLLNNNNFLRVILNSVSELRIKLCYELMYAYYQTEAFKKYLYWEQNPFVHETIIKGLKGLFVPIKSTVVTSWAWKGLSYFAKGYHYGKEKIASVVGPIARSSGVDEKITNATDYLTQVINDSYSPVSSRLAAKTDGGTRKKRKKHRRKKTNKR